MIRDILANDKYVTVEGVIKSKSQPRSTSYGMVCDLVLEDQSGIIAFTLWDEKIHAVHVGDYIRVENGYTRTFHNQPQLNIGKNGKLVILQRSDNL